MSGDGRSRAEGSERDDTGRTARLMVTVLRTVDDVLRWAGLLVDPPLRAAVGRLPAPSRDIAELQFGWLDEGDRRALPGASPALRPALTLISAGAVGGDPHAAVPAAVAVELVHHWSLIQRDLLDGDLSRRHRPTAWSVVGAHPATLGGESLLALAFDVAATGDVTRTAPGHGREHRPGREPDQHAGAQFRPREYQAAREHLPAHLYLRADEQQAARGRLPLRGHLPAPGQPSASERTAATSRSTMRVLGDTVQQLLHGQHTSLSLTDRGASDLLRECLAMAERSTGALLGCACALGALAGGGDQVQIEQLRLFGVRLGLAVRFTEDLLGIWGDPADTGRPSYPDLRRRRRSLPIAAALAAGANEVAEVYRRDDRLGDAELGLIAKAIEQSGARDWCRQQADDLLAQALLAVDLAIPSPAAVTELVSIARWATRPPTLSRV